MLGYVVFNLFSKIYLFLYNEISSTKLSLALGEFNNLNKIEKITDEDISETIDRVNDIIINKKINDNNVQYLVDLIISIDILFQTEVDFRIENYRGPLNSELQDKILLYPKRKVIINRQSGAYPSLTSYLTSIFPIVLKKIVNIVLKTIIYVIKITLLKLLLFPFQY